MKDSAALAQLNTGASCSWGKAICVRGSEAWVSPMDGDATLPPSQWSALPDVSGGGAAFVARNQVNLSSADTASSLGSKYASPQRFCYGNYLQPNMSLE